MALLVCALATACADGIQVGAEEGAGAATENPSIADLPTGIRFDPDGWATDFSSASVDLTEFLSGGPPRDGIPPIDDPQFRPVAEEEDLAGAEPVVAVALPGETPRAYPIQILIWHEIVNDAIGDTEVAVTFCPLCNTAVVFDRTIDGRALTFGTTGNLRRSDLVMWDRQTESWWQQFSGEALVGELTGTTLALVPSQLISWADFRERFPSGQVLTRDTGHAREYGRNPYRGYDELNTDPFLLDPEVPRDDRLAPKERVVTLGAGEDFTIVPFSSLRDRPVRNVRVGSDDVVIFWRPGTASALDASDIAEGRDVGSVVVYSRDVDGAIREFSPGPGETMVDDAGAAWDASGERVDGPGRLRAVAHDTPFWFAVAAFVPDPAIVG